MRVLSREAQLLPQLQLEFQLSWEYYKFSKVLKQPIHPLEMAYILSLYEVKVSIKELILNL